MKRKDTVHHLFRTGLLAVVGCVVGIASLVFYTTSPLVLQPVEANGNAIFAQDSFWNTRLPRYTPLHPNSAGLVGYIERQISSHGSATVNTTSDNAPVYVVQNGQATIAVQEWDCEGDGLIGLSSQLQDVPIPSYAEPAADAEAMMIVYQPFTQTVWELHRARKTGGNWEACGGGRLIGTGGSNGVFPIPYGMTSTGLALSGGQLGIKEMQTSSINHAVGLSLADLESFTSYSWPANRSDGNNPLSTANRIPEGLRFRLDPSVNIDSLVLHPIARVVARAARDYGFVVWNKSGQVGLTSENAKSYTAAGQADPYPALLSGVSESSVMDGFPWDKLQALPMNYGQGGITPSVTSFSASKTTITSGERVTLSWQATNVDSCTIPGNISGQPAIGSWQSPPITIGTVFSVVCGGVAGSASQQIDIKVSGATVNSAPPSGEQPYEIAEAPVTGLAGIIPELSLPEAAETVYKVEYFDQQDLVFATTEPPFSLDTIQLSDGPHALGVKIYYRDGSTADQTKSILIANRTLSLGFASLEPAPSRLPHIIVGVAGGATSVAIMGLAIIRGLRLARIS